MKSKLYRKNDGKLICGVCAGIAETVNIDVTIIRIIAAFLCIYFQIIILLYLILALLLPEKRELMQQQTTAPPPEYGDHNQSGSGKVRISDRSVSMLFAVTLICSGIGLLITRVVFRLEIRVSDFFMFILMGIGIYLLVSGFLEKTDNQKTKIILGVLLSGISVLWLLNIFGLIVFSLSHLFAAIRYLWPLLIVAIGINILIPKKRASLIIWITFALIIVVYAIYLNIDLLASTGLL